MATKKDPTETAAAEPIEVPLDYDSRLEEARAIVKNNVKWAAGIGVVPIPVVDFVGITAIQIRMLKKLSGLYDIPFMEHKVKNLLGSLIIGVGSVKVGAAAAVSLMKFIPVIGPALGVVTLPVVAGALTHATGQVFISHFESGGNFLDFEPEKAREHFKREFDSAHENLKGKAKKA